MCDLKGTVTLGKPVACKILPVGCFVAYYWCIWYSVRAQAELQYIYTKVTVHGYGLFANGSALSARIARRLQPLSVPLTDVETSPSRD